MTDSDLPAGGDSRSWTVDELADMHAGALDDGAAAELWARARDDPDAMAVLDELESTRSELAGLREAPVAPMPDDVAARINAALATEREHAFPSTRQQPAVAPVAPPRQAQPDGQVVDLARRRRAKQLGWGAGLLTAAAAIIAAVAVSLPSQSTQGTPLAGDSSSQPRPADEPLSLRGDDVASGSGETIGVKDFGALGDRAGLDACLAANDLTIDNELLGVRPATVDGQDVVLAVFTTGELARYRMLALPADCDQNRPGVIYDEVVGG